MEKHAETVPRQEGERLVQPDAGTGLVGKFRNMFGSLLGKKEREITPPYHIQKEPIPPQREKQAILNYVKSKQERNNTIRHYVTGHAFARYDEELGGLELKVLFPEATQIPIQHFVLPLEYYESRSGNGNQLVVPDATAAFLKSLPLHDQETFDLYSLERGRISGNSTKRKPDLPDITLWNALEVQGLRFIFMEGDGDFSIPVKLHLGGKSVEIDALVKAYIEEHAIPAKDLAEKTS